MLKPMKYVWLAIEKPFEIYFISDINPSFQILRLQFEWF